MSGFFLITMPRAGGTALARMLGTVADDCAAGLITAARGMGADAARAALGGHGWRSTFFGKGRWEETVAAWSWLLTTFSDMPVIFLTRQETDDYEISLGLSHKTWIPAYGKCDGRVLMDTRTHRESMRNFHVMNPTRTVLIDHADLGDYDLLAAKLGPLAPSREAWEGQAELRPGSRRVLPQRQKPDPAAFEGWQNIDWQADPFAEDSDGDDGSWRSIDWQADPFDDDDSIPATYQRKAARPIVESLPESPRAIVYPWLATAAIWDELRYSLRSVDRYFEDQECPIYILGDRPPVWLKPGGRVQWRAIQGYATSRREGMWQAQVSGVQLADEVCWMNDDICFLRPTGWYDLRVALTEGRLEEQAGTLLRSGNLWKRGLGRAVADLRQFRPGEPVMRFATHTPFLFEREKSLEVLRSYWLDYPGSWVTLYHNHHRTPHRTARGLKTHVLPEAPGVRYLNYNNYKLTDELKTALAERFPDPAPWEVQ